MTVVTVRRQWNDWRHATYLLDDIDGLHWSDFSGGIMVAAPRPFVHGFVLCDRMLGGELAHSCRHGPPPHKIKVCMGTPRISDRVLAVFQFPGMQACSTLAKWRSFSDND